MRYFGLWVVSLFLAIPSGAQPYISANAGIAFVSKADAVDIGGTGFTATFDTGFLLSGSAGQDFGIVRVEGRINYLLADIDQFRVGGIGVDVNGDISALFLLVNVWLDFDNRSPVSPYLGGGIGASFLSVSETEVSGVGVFTESDDQVFAFQFGAGLSLALNSHVILDLGYRFVASNDPKFEAVEAEFTSQHVLFGGRVLF